MDPKKRRKWKRLRQRKLIIPVNTKMFAFSLKIVTFTVYLSIFLYLHILLSFKHPQMIFICIHPQSMLYINCWYTELASWVKHGKNV